MPPISPPKSTQRTSPRKRSSPQKSFRSTGTPQKKTVTVLKYLFLAVLLILVYSLLRINLQLIKRLDHSNRRDDERHADAIAPQTAANSVGNNGEDEQVLQDRLVALRNEVTTMQKRVDDLTERMKLQRSSGANVILGAGDAAAGVR